MSRMVYTLFVDIAGYSKASTDDQTRMVKALNDAVHAAPTFSKASAAHRVLPLPTGDGMALCFDDDLTSPAHCALEIARQIGATLPVRMGIHSGLVEFVTDVNGRDNVAGEGINTAHRVMDFAEPGHILLSDRYAEWLLRSGSWQAKLKPLGTGLAKHNLRIGVYALTDGKIGRTDTPAAMAAKPEPSTEPAPEVVLLCRRGGPREEDILTFLETRLGEQGYTVFHDRSRHFRPHWVDEMKAKLQSAAAVLAVISPESRQSEMLPWELEQVRTRLDEAGRPALLPLFVGGPDEVNDEVERYLHGLPRFVWSGDDDNFRILAEIVSAIRGPLQPSTDIRLEPVGGAVPLDSTFYIRRKCDDEIEAALDAGESILLIPGARQVGKTSLLARAAQHARDAGARVLQTDFQQLNASYLSDETRFYRGLAATLARQQRFTYDFAADWDDFIAPNENLNFFLEALIGSDPTPLVWCLDEADKLFPASFASDFFGLVRSWHNARASRPDGPWRRLTLLIAYATEARLFIRDLNQSPFNVGRKILPEDFDREQVQALNHRYGEPLSPAECDALHALLGGQPFLTRKALDAVASGAWKWPALLADAMRDDGPFHDHLQRLLLGVTELPAVTALVREVLAGTASATADTPTFDRLQSAGVVRQERDGAIRFRCELYRRYLQGHLG